MGTVVVGVYDTLQLFRFGQNGSHSPFIGMEEHRVIQNMETVRDKYNMSALGVTLQSGGTTTADIENDKLKSSYKVITPEPIFNVHDMVILYALPDNDLNYQHGIITTQADSDGVYSVFVMLKTGEGVTLRLTRRNLLSSLHEKDAV